MFEERSVTGVAVGSERRRSGNQQAVQALGAAILRDKGSINERTTKKTIFAAEHSRSMGEEKCGCFGADAQSVRHLLFFSPSSNWPSPP